MERSNVIALVDDDPGAIDTIRRLLEREGLGPVEVFDPKDFANVADYNFLASIGQFGAVILDQKLDELSGVPYTGLELAKYLRAFRPELPLYILTNFPDDSGQFEEAREVEDIIAKRDFNQSPAKYVARILRATSRYEEALSVKSKELGDLIDKRLADTLTNPEAERLAELRAEFERTSPVIESSKRNFELADEESEESRLLKQILSKLEDIS